MTRINCAICMANFTTRNIESGVKSQESGVTLALSAPDYKI